jgi:hypothetical protein
MKTKSATRKTQVSSRKRSGIVSDNSVTKDELLFPSFTPVFSKTTSDSKVLDQIFKIKVLRRDSGKKFNFLTGINRPADHVGSQISAVRQLGILRPVVVAKYEFHGKKDYYIIDGQNLYSALVKLGLDVPYLEISVGSDEELVQAMALVNTSAKDWTMSDYIRAWGHTRRDYIVLAQYIKSHTMTKQAIASVLFGYAGVSTNITRIIKNGLFRVKDEAKAARILNHAEDVLKKAPKMDRNVNRTFTAAYLAYLTKCYSQYNHTKFLEYLKKHSSLLVAANDKRVELIDKFFQNVPK